MFGTKILEERNSKFNGKIRVVKALGMGTYIQANDLTQSGGIVESIWRSIIRKTPNSRFQISEVLILGLGGGTVAKLIRKKCPEAKITGIDIDPTMIELGKKYLGLNRNEIEIEIGDAGKYVSQLSGSNLKSFDLIIVDLYNGDKYPEKFSTDAFLKLILKLLSVGGVAVFNRLYYGDKRPEAVKFGRKLEKIFPKVTWIYPEANLVFLVEKE